MLIPINKDFERDFKEDFFKGFSFMSLLLFWFQLPVLSWRLCFSRRFVAYPLTWLRCSECPARYLQPLLDFGGHQQGCL